MSRNQDMIVPEIDMLGLYDDNMDVVSTTVNPSNEVIESRDANDIIVDDKDFVQSVAPTKPDEIFSSNDFYVKSLEPITDDFAKKEAATTSKAEEFKKQIDSRNQPKEVEIPQEAVEIAFDFIKENGLLYIPEGVELNNENLAEILQYDQNLRNEAALQYLKDQAGDEYVANLFELVYNGGTLDDLENGKQVMQDEKFFRNLDVTKEDNQRKVIEAYLKEGLDPSKPSYNQHLNRISKEVDDIINSYLGKEKAEEAVAYFLDVIEQDKIALQQEIQHRKEQEALELERRTHAAEKWQKDFVYSLVERDWTKAKKDEVLSQLAKVELDNGQKVQLYKYKLDRILEDPKHSQMLMQFLTTFDEYELKWKNNSDSPTRLATSKILEIANKKAVHSPASKDGRFYADEDENPNVFESK